jgi:TfoX C-terminal domain
MKIGDRSAFNKMYTEGDSYGDFNAAYLYALEGAIQDCDWLDIPEENKQIFKNYAQDLQAIKKEKS